MMVFERVKQRLAWKWRPFFFTCLMIYSHQVLFLLFSSSWRCPINSHAAAIVNPDLLLFRLVVVVVVVFKRDGTPLKHGPA